MIEKEDGVLLSIEEAAEIGSLCGIAACFCEDALRLEVSSNMKTKDCELRMAEWESKKNVSEKYKKLFHNFYRTQKGFGWVNEK